MSKVNSEPINRGLDDTDAQRGTFTYENLTFEDCRGGRDPECARHYRGERTSTREPSLSASDG